MRRASMGLMTPKHKIHLADFGPVMYGTVCSTEVVYLEQTKTSAAT